MDESAHDNSPEPEQPTPEVAQLLKLLDLQTAAQRERRAALPKSFQGASFRYGSIIVIVVFGLGSIALMEWFISQLPKPGHPLDTAPASVVAPAAKNGIPGNAEPNSAGKPGSNH